MNEGVKVRKKVQGKNRKPKSKRKKIGEKKNQEVMQKWESMKSSHANEKKERIIKEIDRNGKKKKEIVKEYFRMRVFVMLE